MKFAASVLAVLATVSSVAAHGSIDHILADGVSHPGPLPGGPPMASNIRQITDLDPVFDETSSNIICGWGPVQPASQVGTVKAGSQMQVFYRSGQPGVNWPHTFGPLMTYMGKCDNAKTCDASKVKWFKIDELGQKPGTTPAQNDWYMYDVSQGRPYNFTIPSSIQSGDYLIRHEILAVHNAMTKDQAEFYDACSQWTVTGGGSATPPSNVLTSFPGAYKDTDPGILVNIYTNPQPYVFPGPPVWPGGSAAVSVSGSQTGSGTGGQPSKSSPTTSSHPKSTSTQVSSPARTGAGKPKHCSLNSRRELNRRDLSGTNNSRITRRFAEGHFHGRSH